MFRADAISRSLVPCLSRICLRNKSTNNWQKLKKVALSKDLAMQHFDNFYSKVYGESWQSIRVGLLTPNKYSAVVNNFCAPDETIKRFEEELKCVNLSQYYKRHLKKSKRYRLRMKILNDKKMKRREWLAKERGVDPNEINMDEVFVSDVSDSELRAAGLSSGSGTEAEDFPEMFQTENEEREEIFKNQASIHLSLDDYVEPTEFKYQEIPNEGDKKYYSFYQAEIDVPVEFINEEEINFPETLKAYTFSRRMIKDFPKPKVISGVNVMNYYCLDGASLLPTLVLGLKPKDTVADFCASPGGKSLCMIQSLLPSNLLCNEISESRMSRLQTVFKTFIPKMNITNEMVEMRLGDARTITGSFDKILLDVPCTNDRRSAMSDENNIFKASRVKERISLPQQQCDLLLNAFKCMKPGGSLVYSTCSLSPIQNDGVVHMTLAKLREETDIEVFVVNLKEALRPLRGLFRFHRKMKYGQQVLPFLPSNFGPMYFCKFVRKK